MGRRGGEVDVVNCYENDGRWLEVRILIRVYME